MIWHTEVIVQIVLLFGFVSATREYYDPNSNLKLFLTISATLAINHSFEILFVITNTLHTLISIGCLSPYLSSLTVSDGNTRNIIAALYSASQFGMFILLLCQTNPWGWDSSVTPGSFPLGNKICNIQSLQEDTQL